jgi:FKBP-type peptidyl-prolyl cis-trans isomerase FklB
MHGLGRRGKGGIINLEATRKMQRTERKGNGMKLIWLVIACMFLASSPVLAEEKPALKTPKEKSSYVIGVDVGRTLQKAGVEIDADLLARGIRDALAGGKLLMNEQEIQETMTAFQAEMTVKQARARKELGEKNEKEGEKFLAENGKKPGVTTLPSGLQYKVLRPGKGRKPQPQDIVKVHYRGTLINGTEFDSSIRRGQPARLAVNRIIPGWTEALQLMEEGAKWQIFIPSNLAYGERGAGGSIGPNATLIFEVELLEIEKGKK